MSQIASTMYVAKPRRNSSGCCVMLSAVARRVVRHDDPARQVGLAQPSKDYGEEHQEGDPFRESRVGHRGRCGHGREILWVTNRTYALPNPAVSGSVRLYRPWLPARTTRTLR